jgi:hypothetical protein
VHNEELLDFHSSPSIIGMMEGRRLRWEGHVALLGVDDEWTRLIGRKVKVNM